ncbi:MAG: sigma-70 family RNA polymerase sigma factor [Candidatus Limivivens sp.]|nr:sigma-70 family RNA polymerase sigma factor [Candidatus Limivivens sp.]
MQTTDLELLKKLEQDPQNAMVLLVEQYTVLIWKVAEQYLSNPEDVKECVNEVFTQFYLHRDRFDPEQGTLAAYLAATAKHRAISRYRKERSRQSMPLEENLADEGVSREIDSRESRIDLEKALASLTPEELSLIRMSYYNGMTDQEIADSLNLTYHTVKKRRQRTLTKLQRMLLIVLATLLIALLTACAVGILRYFGVVPGYGINQNQDAPVFTLEETTVYENDLFSAEASGVYVNDCIRIVLRIDLKGYTYLELKESSDHPLQMNGNLLLESGESIKPTQCSGIIQNVSTTGYFILLYENVGLTDIPDSVLNLSVLLDETLLPITFVRTTDEAAVKYPYALTEEGGLLAVPRLENGELILSIYPLNVGDYAINPGLVRGNPSSDPGGPVTVTAADGSVFTGECIGYRPFSNSFYYDWNFGPVPPGEYTLNVPYIYQTMKPLENIDIVLHPDTCRWEDQEYAIAGTPFSMKVVDFQSLEPVVKTETSTVKGKEPVTIQKEYLRWNIQFQFTSSDPTRHLEQTLLVARLPDGSGYLPNAGLSMYSQDLESGIMNYEFYYCPDSEDILSDLLLQYDLSESKTTCDLSFRWDHSFTIPFTVEEDTGSAS